MRTATPLTTDRRGLGERFRTYARFVRIEHTVFSLPVVYAGAWLADLHAPFRDLGLILMALIGARTAALAMNRWLDRDLDARNPRTRKWELPSGRIRPREVQALIIGGLALYAVAAWALSPWCLALSPLPALVFWFYPQMKRWTVMAHFGVGSALALAPLAGFFAIVKTPEVMLNHPALLDVLALAFFVLCWVAGFDIIYAVLDVDFDRSHGLYSIPARWGVRRALQAAAFLHTVGLTALAGIVIRRGVVGPGVLLTGVVLTTMFAVEHILARRGRLEAAFFQVNALVGFVVLGLILSVLMEGP